MNIQGGEPASDEARPMGLTLAEKDALDKGLRSVKEGRVKSHDEVVEATRRKYPQIKK